MTWGVPLLVSYHFAFSYCSWGSQGKNTEMACHSLLQWTTFCQTSIVISSVQFSPSVMSDSLRPHRLQASVSITWSLLKLMSIGSVMPSNHLILCHPLLLLPSIFPSIRVFSNESVLRIRWLKCWSFSFSISLSNEHQWTLISSRMDWLDLLAVQVTFKSLLQHHSSKASILWHSAFLIVQRFTWPLEKP